MIIDQLFEDDKKKKLNEIDPRNYDSDEDYYRDLYGNDQEDDDVDMQDDDVADMDHDEESYYEKYVRTKNLEEEQLDELSWKDIQRGAKKIGKGAQKFTKNVANTGAAIGGAARDVGGAIKQVGKTAIADPVSAAYGATKSGLNKAANVAANTYGDVKAGAQKIGQAGATVGTDLGNAAKSIGRGVANVAGGTAGALGTVAGGATTGAGRAAARGFNTGVQNVGGDAIDRMQTNIMVRKPEAIKKDIEDKTAEIEKLNAELEQASAPKAKAQQPWGIAAINPETGKQWLPSEVPDYVEPKDVTQAKKDAEIERQEQEVAAELERERLKTQMQKGERQPGDWARARELANRTIVPTDVSKNVQNWGQRLVAPKAGMQKLAKDLTSPTPSFAQSQTQAQSQPPGFNATSAMNLPGMEKYAKPTAPIAPIKSPNFAQQSSGYANVNQPTVRYGSKPAAPTGTKVTSGGPTPAERKALDQRIAAAAQAQPVAETVKQVKRMMETATSRADVQRIKDYIDYHMGNNLTEGAKVKRNRLISEVTQLAATRRREIARQMAQ